MKKYTIKNCPCNVTVDEACNDENQNETYCKDIPDCLLKQIVEKLKPLQIITFEHGIKGMFTVETKGELKQVSEIFKLLEIEEC